MPLICLLGVLGRDSAHHFLNVGSLQILYLKVHKIENFFDSDF